MKLEEKKQFLEQRVSKLKEELEKSLLELSATKKTILRLQSIEKHSNSPRNLITKFTLPPVTIEEKNQTLNQETLGLIEEATTLLEKSSTIERILEIEDFLAIKMYLLAFEKLREKLTDTEILDKITKIEIELNRYSTTVHI